MTDATPSTAAPEPLSVADGPPPSEMAFTDHGRIAGEPSTDRLVVTATGLALRERLVRVGDSADRTLGAGGAPNAFSVMISHAFLDSAGAVQRDDAGRPRLASAHELVLTHEALGRLGSSEAVQAEVDRARRIAVHRAATEARGIDLHEQILADRLAPITEGA